MLLNIFAEPVSRSSESKEIDLKKAIHYLENELHHTTLQVSKPKRSSNTIPQLLWDPELIGEPTMQLSLIDEEYQEFRSAFHNEPYEAELKELADLVCVLSVRRKHGVGSQKKHLIVSTNQTCPSLVWMEHLSAVLTAKS